MRTDEDRILIAQIVPLQLFDSLEDIAQRRTMGEGAPEAVKQSPCICRSVCRNANSTAHPSFITSVASNRPKIRSTPTRQTNSSPSREQRPCHVAYHSWTGSLLQAMWSCCEAHLYQNEGFGDRQREVRVPRLRSRFRTFGRFGWSSIMVAILYQCGRLVS